MTHALTCSLNGSTYTKIGTIQRRLAWPLRKDDTQIREAFQIFFLCGRDILNKLYELHCHFLLQITKYYFQGITSLNRRFNGYNNP